MKESDKTEEKNTMSIVSWNVNGFKRLLKAENGEYYKIRNLNPDFICLQETWYPDPTIPGLRETYKTYSNPCTIASERNGVAIITDKEPQKVIYGFGEPEPDLDGCATRS